MSVKLKAEVKDKKTRKINNSSNAKDEFIMQMCWGLACQKYL